MSQSNIDEVISTLPGMDFAQYYKTKEKDRNQVTHIKLGRICPGPFVYWQTVRDSVDGTKWFVGDSSDSGEIKKPVTSAGVSRGVSEGVSAAGSRHDNVSNAFKKRPTSEEVSGHSPSQYRLISLEGNKGDAELIRLILCLADVQYEDCKLTKEDWEEMKEDLPFNTLPIFSKGDHVCGDVSAIIKTLAQLFKLTGVSNKDYLVTQATYDRLRRLQKMYSEAITCIVRGSNNKEKMEWAQSQLTHVVLPTAFGEWEPLIKISPGPFISESGMTLADLAIMDFVDQCTSNLVIAPILEQFPAVSDLITMVRRHPRINYYLEERDKKDQM